MPSRTRIAALLLLALGLAACNGQDAPATGATPAGEDAAAVDAPAAEPVPAAVAESESDPGSIELDMPRVERMMAALAAIAKLHEGDPSLEDVTAMDANESFDTYVARLEGHPQVSAAIEAAGTTPREFALTSMALTAAMFAHGMMEAGAIKELPEGINAQHVEFVKEHQDEIAAMMQGGAAG